MVVGIICAVIIGILEMPFCCTCVTICNKIAGHLKFFEIYFARGMLYIGLGVAMIAVIAMQEVGPTNRRWVAYRTRGAAALPFCRAIPSPRGETRCGPPRAIQAMQEKCIVIPFWGCVVILTGICYCVGHFRGERHA
jgi:hypothetical protein